MSEKVAKSKTASHGQSAPKYPGIRVTCNGNQLVAQWVETRITEGGVFYPITPSTEGGEIYQGSYRARRTQRLGPAENRRRNRRRTCRARWRDGVLGHGPAHGEFHFRPGHRVCDGAVLSRAGKTLDDGARSRRARADQTGAERALRPRRFLRRARHRLDDAGQQGRATGRRPGHHSAQGQRTGAESGNEHSGRNAHNAQRAHVSRAGSRVAPRIPRRAG